MSKHPISKEVLAKTVRVTQEIEGYTEASDSVKRKALELKAKYGIKVSPRK